MIKQRNVEVSRQSSQATGDQNIGFAWPRVSARVIMDEEIGVSLQLEGSPDNTIERNRAAREFATGNRIDREQIEFGVHE